jgi:hypothetical protein
MQGQLTYNAPGSPHRHWLKQAYGWMTRDVLLLSAYTVIAQATHERDGHERAGKPLRSSTSSLVAVPQNHGPRLRGSVGDKCAFVLRRSVFV